VSQHGAFSVTNATLSNLILPSSTTAGQKTRYEKLQILVAKKLIMCRLASISIVNACSDKINYQMKMHFGNSDAGGLRNFLLRNQQAECKFACATRRNVVSHHGANLHSRIMIKIHDTPGTEDKLSTHYTCCSILKVISTHLAYLQMSFVASKMQTKIT